jgi:hypothetical protein
MSLFFALSFLNWTHYHSQFTKLHSKRGRGIRVYRNRSRVGWYTSLVKRIVLHCRLLVSICLIQQVHSDSLSVSDQFWMRLLARELLGTSLFFVIADVYRAAFVAITFYLYNDSASLCPCDCTRP